MQKLFVSLTCHPLLALLRQSVGCVFPPAPLSVDHKAWKTSLEVTPPHSGVRPQEMSKLWGNTKCFQCPQPFLSGLHVPRLASSCIWIGHTFYPAEEKPRKAGFVALLKDTSAFSNPLALQSRKHCFTPLCRIRSFPYSFLLKTSGLWKAAPDARESLNASLEDPIHKNLFRRHQREDVSQLQSTQSVIPLQVKMLSYFTLHAISITITKRVSFTSILNATSF